VDAKQGLLTKKLDEEVNSLVRTQVEKQLTNKRQNVSSSKNFEFFSTKVVYKKDEVQQKYFFEDLALLICKNHLFTHFLESPWLNPHIVFPFRKIFSQEILPNLVQKVKDVYVLLELFFMYVSYCKF